MEKSADAFRTISEVADELDVPQHVLRFWESRFAQIRPMKRGGGRRYYRPEDVDLLRGIRHLLYGEGYTIRGVQRILRDQGVRLVQSVWQEGAEQPARGARDLRAAQVGEEVQDEESGRRLFGMLPSIGAREDYVGDGDRLVHWEPPMAAAPMPHVDPADRLGAPAGLSREDTRLLKATLEELTECRRLIEIVLADRA